MFANILIILINILLLALPAAVGWFILQIEHKWNKKLFAKFFAIGFLSALAVFIISILAIDEFVMLITDVILMLWAYLLISSGKRAGRYAEKHGSAPRDIIVPFWTGTAFMLTCLYPILSILYEVAEPFIDFLYDKYDAYCAAFGGDAEDWNFVTIIISYWIMEIIAGVILLLKIIIYIIINHVKKRKEEKSRYMNNDQSEG